MGRYGSGMKALRQVGNATTVDYPEESDVKQATSCHDKGGVGLELDRLGSAIDDLENAITGLADRIAPVLVVSPPSPAEGCGEKACSPRSDVTNVLAQYTTAVRSLRGRINDMVERCEL